MANFGIKTPVSCLQEYLVSKKMIPQYELIYNGVGTHNPEFIFRVQVGTLWEEGCGRSKQEAKHRAAEKMLKSLKVVDAKTQEEETNEFIKEFNENYVGQLKDLCILQRYPTPKYYLEEASGPSHNRVFKMICCVSQLQDFGISRTKKQAKHQAAFKMLQLLKEVGNTKNEESLPHPGNLNKPAFSLTDEEIVEKYASLKPTKSVICEDPAAYYKDHHKAYIDLQETSPALMKLINETDKINFENSINLVQEITEELKVTLIKTEIPSKEGNDYTVLTMTVFPSVAAIGVNERSAAFHLLNTLLILCKQ